MAGPSLYGTKDPSKTQTKNVSSSTSLAFSTHLASLISKDSARTATGRPRPSKAKTDIFTQHNKNSKKRAAGDLADEAGRRHQTEADIGVVDGAALQRSKRRMEEKAQIYRAMKRGDYIRPEDGRKERTLVDFDRKWAEQEANVKSNGGANDDDDDDAPISSASGDSSDDDEAEQLIEYEDELGRSRKGTKAEAAREERRQRRQVNAVEEEERFSARPKMPTNVIHGDTVQRNAFNPDESTTEKMASLAQKRDRSATPPPEVHYDANTEVRSKGTGFYVFSQDGESRRHEMGNLEKERLQTERGRREREERKEKKRREIEVRKMGVAELKSKVEANRFLNQLGLDLDPDKDESSTGG